MTSPTLGFLGAGQMARALASGMVQAKLVEPHKILAADPFDEARQGFASTVPGAQVTDENAQVIRSAEVVILCVKPQQMPTLLAEIAPLASAHPLVVSIAAGVSLATLSAGLGFGRIIRVMPNTPALVGMGAAAYAVGPGASEADATLVGQLLSAVGIAVQVEEPALDAVTGLSGSGPAFVYQVIDALCEAGTEQGLSEAIARELAVQTVLGAAQMVHQTGESPAVLTDRVASAGGTTVAGLQVLQAKGLKETLRGAVEAATRRSEELAQQSD